MKTNLPYNLHSHTNRCGHASGEDYEYCNAALAAGFRELGFSDHVFLPGVHQPTIRADVSRLDEYLNSIKSLKETYKGRLLIRAGFEAEWLGKKMEDYYRALLQRGDFEYLCLGQHGYLENGEIHWYARLPREVRLQRFADDLIAGMASGLFSFVCHPDMFVHWQGEWDKEIDEVTRRIAQASIEYDIPLEINGSYLRSQSPVKHLDPLNYPCPMFWEVISTYGCKTVIGIDAHSPADYEVTDYDYLFEFAKKHKLNLLLESPLSAKK